MRNVKGWVPLPVVTVTLTCLGGGSVTSQTSEVSERIWTDLRTELEVLRGDELLGLNSIDYGRFSWVNANAARDSRSYDWLFLEGNPRDFVREYVFVENGIARSREVSSTVKKTERHEQKGSGLFDFLVRDIWWTHYTETVGDRYKIRHDVPDRHANRADGSGRKPSGHFLLHAVEVIQRHVTDACERRVSGQATLASRLDEALSSDAIGDRRFWREVVGEAWPLPPGVCEPENESGLSITFQKALSAVVQSQPEIKPPPPSE